MWQRRTQPRAFWIALGLCGVALSACGANTPLDTLAQGETGRVVRIIDGDALVLDTGLSVRLVGIEAPVTEWRARNREAEPFAEEAKRMLEDMALGRQVQLIYPGVTRDRYDRALAYARTDDNLGPQLWLNEEMVRLGGARARIYPDTSRLGDSLVNLEAGARAQKTGLWALPSWTIPAAADLDSDARGFYILTGHLDGIGVSADPEAVCSRGLKDSEIRVNILSNAAALCEADNAEWPKGRHVRLRGYLRERELEISHIFNAEQISTAPEPDQTSSANTNRPERLP
jgi:endonuclease YncB( thermonuclease family)